MARFLGPMAVEFRLGCFCIISSVPLGFNKTVYPSPSPHQTLALPSHVHYELVLQLLEQQSMPSLKPGTPAYSQVQNIIVQLRKAVAFQKNLEHECEQAGWKIDYRWSLTEPAEQAS